jgi:hypothetical protein
MTQQRALPPPTGTAATGMPNTTLLPQTTCLQMGCHTQHKADVHTPNVQGTIAAALPGACTCVGWAPYRIMHAPGTAGRGRGGVGGGGG